MAGPLNQDVLNSLGNFTVPGLVTPNNIPVGKPSAPVPATPPVGSLIDQMRANGQFAGYGIPGAPVPAPAAAVPAASAAPAPAIGQPPAAPPMTPAQRQAFLAGMPDYVPGKTQGAAQGGLRPPLPDNMLGNSGVPGLPQGPVPGGPAAAYSPAAANAAGMWATPVTTSGGGVGAPSVNGRYIDPTQAIQHGYDQQLAYQQAALQNIMAAARQGNPDNYSFRLAHLIGAMGANNFAGIQGQGVDALNQSIAGVSAAGMNAGAAMYGSDQALKAHLAQVGEEHYQSSTGSVQTGTTLVPDAMTGISVAVPTYGQRPAAAGGMPTPYPTTPQGNRPVVGATYRDRNGQRAVYQSDGTYKPVAQ